MGFLLFIHVLVCILLIITILMQAGKGGGLAESFASAESMFGTQTNSFMVRTSTVLAAIFLTTSLILAVSGAKGEKSLMANKKLLPAQAAVVKSTNEPEVTVNVSDPKPAGSIMETIDLSPEQTMPVKNVQENVAVPVVNAVK